MVFQDGFNLADAPFHVALVVFGGVIVAIFFEVAHLAGPADAGCDFDSPARGEVKVFCLQTLKGHARKSVRRHTVRLSIA